MNIIQSFWTGNVSDKNPLTINGGWLKSEYHWMSWALSCLQLKKIFGEVELISDSLGKLILIDLLHLPYSKVSVALDNIMEGYPNEIWGLSKIHSYSIQEKPFIHFDGDFFLWKPFKWEILSAEVLVQNKEIDLPFYKMTLDEINKHFVNIPSYFKQQNYNNKSIISINAGVIGGNNLNFFRKYRNAAFDFINSNIDKLSAIKTSNLNFIFEQYLLFCLAEESKTPITYLSDKIVDDLIYAEYVNFSKIHDIQFIHPVGGHKKNIEVCDNLSKKLRMEYPAFYEVTLNTLQSAGLQLSNKIHLSNGTITVNNSDTDPEEYRRTTASIKYLMTKNPVTHTFEILKMTKDINEQKVFDKILNALSIKEGDKQILSEIYSIEKIKKQTYQQAFKNSLELSASYLNDISHYKKMQNSFYLQNEAITQIKIFRNTFSIIIPVTTNWICVDVNLIEDVVRFNFENTERINELMIFVPQIIRTEIDEFILDKLDSLLFDFCAEVKLIKDILEHAATFFDTEEIAENYDAFFNLIIGSVIRLCYQNILCIKLNK